MFTDSNGNKYAIVDKDVVRNGPYTAQKQFIRSSESAAAPSLSSDTQSYSPLIWKVGGAVIYAENSYNTDVTNLPASTWIRQGPDPATDRTECLVPTTSRMVNSRSFYELSTTEVTPTTDGKLKFFISDVGNKIWLGLSHKFIVQFFDTNTQ